MSNAKPLMSEEASVAQLGVFFDYLKSKGRSSILIKAMEADYSVALEKSGFKKIRQLTKEMRELMRETFSQEQRMECLQLMVNRGVLKEENFEALKVDELLAKNKISTQEDFESLMAFVNEHSQNSESLKKIDLANKILHQFTLVKKSKLNPTK